MQSSAPDLLHFASAAHTQSATSEHLPGTSTTRHVTDAQPHSPLRNIPSSVHATLEPRAGPQSTTPPLEHSRKTQRAPLRPEAEHAALAQPPGPSRVSHAVVLPQDHSAPSAIPTPHQPRTRSRSRTRSASSRAASAYARHLRYVDNDGFHSPPPPPPAPRHALWHPSVAALHVLRTRTAQAAHGPQPLLLLREVAVWRSGQPIPEQAPTETHRVLGLPLGVHQTSIHNRSRSNPYRSHHNHAPLIEHRPALPKHLQAILQRAALAPPLMPLLWDQHTANILWRSATSGPRSGTLHIGLLLSADVLAAAITPDALWRIRLFTGPLPVEHMHFISHRMRNKLHHALHGNGPSDAMFSPKPVTAHHTAATSAQVVDSSVSVLFSPHLSCSPPPPSLASSPPPPPSPFPPRLNCDCGLTLYKATQFSARRKCNACQIMIQRNDRIGECDCEKVYCNACCSIATSPGAILSKTQRKALKDKAATPQGEAQPPRSDCQCGLALTIVQNNSGKTVCAQCSGPILRNQRAAICACNLSYCGNCSTQLLATAHRKGRQLKKSKTEPPSQTAAVTPLPDTATAAAAISSSSSAAQNTAMPSATVSRCNLEAPPGLEPAAHPRQLSTAYQAVAATTAAPPASAMIVPRRTLYTKKQIAEWKATVMHQPLTAHLGNRPADTFRQPPGDDLDERLAKLLPLHP